MKDHFLPCGKQAVSLEEEDSVGSLAGNLGEILAVRWGIQGRVNSDEKVLWAF